MYCKFPIRIVSKCIKNKWISNHSSTLKPAVLLPLLYEIFPRIFREIMKCSKTLRLNFNSENSKITTSVKGHENWIILWVPRAQIYIKNYFSSKYMLYTQTHTHTHTTTTILLNSNSQLTPATRRERGR